MFTVQLLHAETRSMSSCINRYMLGMALIAPFGYNSHIYPILGACLLTTWLISACAYWLGCPHDHFQVITPNSLFMFIRVASLPGDQCLIVTVHHRPEPAMTIPGICDQWIGHWHIHLLVISTLHILISLISYKICNSYPGASGFKATELFV